MWDNVGVQFFCTLELSRQLEAFVTFLNLVHKVIVIKGESIWQCMVCVCGGGKITSTGHLKISPVEQKLL